MAYPQSGSLLQSRINSGLSTQITIKVGPTTVGAIQSASPRQTREISMWEEIGTDGIVDSHPKNAARIEFAVERIVFDQLKLTEAFSRGFINIQAQRIPFDIQIIDRSDQEGQFSVVHTLHNCWFNSYSSAFNVNSYIVSESATIRAEKITTHRGGQSAVGGGLRGITFEYDEIERNTDVSGRVARFSSLPNTPNEIFQIFTNG